MNPKVEEFISHHGVKGMRWGQRRARGGVSTGKSGKSSKGGAKPKTKTTQRTKFGKSPSRLSDAELQKRVKRMEVEKKYNDLNKKDVTGGKKFASDILSSTGKTILTTVIAGAALYGISKALSTQMNPKAAEAITGKKLPDAMRKIKVKGLPPPIPGTRVG